MTLSDYITQVQGLLHNSTGTLYNTAEITRNVNSARSQLAGESRSLRALGTYSMTNPVPQSFSMSSIVLASPAGTVGYTDVLDVRQIVVIPPTGTRIFLNGRPWEWYFRNYVGALHGIPVGRPREWAQLAYGVGGSVWPAPTPVIAASTTWVFSCDCVVLPAPMVNPGDVDCIQYPWTDAVQYFAAYLSLLGVSRIADADKMFMNYQAFMVRGRQLATAMTLPQNAPAPLAAVGISGGGGAGGGASGGASGGA